MEYNFIGWCLMSTPKEEEQVTTRESIKEKVLSATLDAPADVALAITKGGIGGGYTLCKSGIKPNPIGYLLPGKTTHDDLGEPNSKEEIAELIENGAAPKIIGIEGSKYLIGFIDGSEEMNAMYGDIVTRVAKASGLTEDEINDRIAYMISMDVSESIIEKVLDLYEKVDGVRKPNTLYQAIEEKDIEGELVSETVISRMLRNIVVGNNILLEGPKSTGKDVAWETIAWLTNRQLNCITMNSEVSKEDTFGMWTTDNAPSESLSESNLGSFLKFAKAVFKASFKKRKAAETEAEADGEKLDKSHLGFLLNVIKTMGTTLKFAPGFIGEALVDGNKKITVLDEMNMGRANILASALNTILDDHSTEVYIPGMGRVEIPKHLIVGGTQNGESDGMMSGIQMQNEATLSRFVIIRMTPSSGSVKSIFEAANTGASDEQITLADKIFCVIRDSYIEDAISGRAVSPRNFNMFLRNVSKGQPIKEALLESVLNQCEPDETLAIIGTLRQEGLL